MNTRTTALHQQTIDGMKASMREICRDSANLPNVPSEGVIKLFQAFYRWPKCKQEGDV